MTGLDLLIILCVLAIVATIIVVAGEPPRPWRCECCGHRFESLDALTAHERVM